MHRARRRITLVVVLIVLATIGASVVVTTRSTSAASSPTSIAGPRHPKVAMIGDSITYSAQPTLTLAFRAAGWEPTIKAHPGDMFRDRMQVARDIAAEDPDVVVINLGTNDESCVKANLPDSGLIPCRYPDFTASDEAADMLAMLALFPLDRTCVVGVLPTTAAGATVLWRFREQTGTVSGLIDWGEESRAHLENLWDPTGHLTELGIENYSTFVTDHVSQICQAKLDTSAG